MTAGGPRIPPHMQLTNAGTTADATLAKKGSTGVCAVCFWTEPPRLETACVILILGIRPNHKKLGDANEAQHMGPQHHPKPQTRSQQPRATDTPITTQSHRHAHQNPKPQTRPLKLSGGTKWSVHRQRLLCGRSRRRSSVRLRCATPFRRRWEGLAGGRKVGAACHGLSAPDAPGR